uniref:cache domain-containing protein n=1 Tax=Promineifilum sp. TaxID=2664178 RepID=UPI0035AE158B
MRSSLRRKILTWTFLPAVVIFLIVAAASFFLSQAVVEDLVIDRDQELARLTAAELSASLEEYPTLLSGVARDISGVNLNGPTVSRALTNNANRLTYFDGGAVLLNNLGRVVAAYPEQPDLEGADWSARAYFRDIIQNPGRPAFSDIAPDGPDGAEVLVTAVPVFGPTNELRGVLTGMFRLGSGTLNPLYGTFIRLRLDRKGNAHVVDGAGRLIFATDTGAAGEDFTTHPVAPAALSGESGALRTPSEAGTDVLASYSPIPGTSWSLIIEEEWATLMGPLRNFSALLSLLLALGVIIPALVVAASMTRVTRPINALVEGTRQVARGDFGRTVEAHTGDELEMLANQFNEMSAQLQASYTELERRVEARTRELQTVLQVSRNMASTLELQPLLSRLLDQLQKIVDYRFARLFIVEDGQLILFEERGFNLDMPGVYYLNGAAEADAMLNSGEPLIVVDARQESPIMEHVRRVSAERGTEGILDEIGSFISLPLLARERQVGILTLIHGESGYYTPARVEVVRAFAAQASVAIENARLFTAEQERVNQLRVINQVSQTIAGILDVDGLLR